MENENISEDFENPENPENPEVSETSEIPEISENEPPIDFSPIKMFAKFGILGKLVILAGLAFAIISVAASRPEPLTEGVSAYLTMLFLLWLAVTDFKHFKVPNKILLAWLLCRAVLMLASTAVTANFAVLVNSALGAIAMGIFFLITYYLSRRTLGGGDVKLSFVLGLSLGINMIFSAVLYGLIICAVFSLGALLLKKLNRKDPVPLVPFLFAGTALMYLMNGL
ncbi:MAG: A24 family peptidase [Defluviitaleaceae bacterium]|nr:A24 family peptidase [Defluviitaleaceae bacterium]